MPADLRGRIFERLHRLEVNPWSPGCIKLSGPADWYRLRVGDWRIVYSVEAATRELVILRIARRETAYRLRRQLPQVAQATVGGYSITRTVKDAAAVSLKMRRRRAAEGN